MTRREFVVSTAAVGALALPMQAAEEGNSPTERLIADLIRANDAGLPATLAKQERRAGHPWRGGMPNEHGIHTVGGTSGLIAAIACAAAAPASKYAGTETLVEPLDLAIQYMIRAQHADGTIDLVITNFHSPPDLAFVLEVVSPACALLRGARQPAFTRLADELGTFIKRGAGALVTGGVHTPNHRWVVCAGLAWAHALYPDPRYVARIEQWLAEGIDLDPDGQYTEKSTTVYSPIVNRALITVARVLQRPALLEPVRRNLEMTLYYVHPDGEVVTEASRRQDRYQRGSMARYYYGYRWLALRDNNGRFAAMARHAERTTRNQVGELMAFLTEPEFRREMPADAVLPTDYVKVFTHSSLARIRRGLTSATVLAQNPTLFSFRKGGAALEAVRLASAFFGKGQFEGATLEVINGGFLLRQELDGPYYQPLTADQIAQGEHTRMAPNGTLAPNSRALRARSNEQSLTTTCEIREVAGRAGAFSLQIASRGTERVPVAVELAFRHGGVLEGVTPVAGVKDAFVLEREEGRYTAEGQTITFGPGASKHSYTQLRGALPKWDGLSVYLTGFTPFESTLTIS